MKLQPRHVVYFPNTLVQPKHNIFQYNTEVSPESRIASTEERLDYIFSLVEAKAEQEIRFKQEEWETFKTALELLVASQPKLERRNRA